MDTLTRMQAYIEVVDSEGFSAAARKLGKSKALMSKYVRELEDELGILLLNRTTRQFSLTEAGEIYYHSAIEILNRVTVLQDTVRETGKGLKGRLRVSAPRSLTDLEIGLPIVEFSAEYPDITLDVNLDDRMVDMVEDGFDVAISDFQTDGLFADCQKVGRLPPCGRGNAGIPGRKWRTNRPARAQQLSMCSGYQSEKPQQPGCSKMRMARRSTFRLPVP